MPRDPENDIRLAKLAEEAEAKAKAEDEQQSAEFQEVSDERTEQQAAPGL